MKSSGNNWNTSAEIWSKLKPHARRMRKNPTHAENLLWNEIKNKKLNGIKFRRQHAVEYFIVDFYTRDFNLIIEVDGDVHNEKEEEDKSRQAFLEGSDFKVIRFSNEEILNSMKSVLERILVECKI